MQTVQGTFFYPVKTFATLRDMLVESERRFGGQDAFRFRLEPGQEPVTRTFSQFNADWRALGSALTGLGLGGSRIAVIGENSYFWSVVHTAVLNGVGVSVPLDRLLPGDEIIALLERGEVSAVFYDAAFQGIMDQAIARLPGQIRLLCCLRPDRIKPSAGVTFAPVPEQPDVLRSAGTGKPLTVRLEDLLALGRRRRESGDRTYDQVVIDPDALASLLFTSGTTSVSKAVMLSHGNICADIAGVAGMVRIRPRTRMLSILPLHHTFENTCGLFMSLAYGCEVVICDGLRYIQKNLQEYSIDMIIGVPAVFENFYRKVQDTLRKTGKEKLVSRMIVLTRGLRALGIDVRRKVFKDIHAAFGGRLALGICGAAPVKPEIIRFFDDIGLRILQGYGLTETSPVAAGCNDYIFVAGTVGRPVGGVEVAIDTDVPGEPGEILVRGPIVMKGYYKDPEATAAAISADGWFHTGDVGTINPKNSCLTITGRLKSMIVLGNGKKVFPEEIEFLINQSPLVRESLVWGEHDPSGEVIVAAKVVIDPERMQAEGIPAQDEAALKRQLDQLMADINSRLPSFKSVRHYVYSFSDMVKTTSLKIRRQVEISGIHELLERQKLRLRELTGRNIDTYSGGTAGLASEKTTPAGGSQTGEKAAAEPDGPHPAGSGADSGADSGAGSDTGSKAAGSSTDSNGSGQDART